MPPERNGNGFPRWLGMLLLGTVVALGSSAVQRAWDESRFGEDLDELRDDVVTLNARVEYLRVKLVDDGGVVSDQADLANRVRDLERKCL